MTEFSTWHDGLRQDMLLGEKRLAVLVDPENAPRGDGWLDLINAIQQAKPQMCSWAEAWWAKAKPNPSCVP